MLSSVMRGDCFRHIFPTTQWIEQQSYALVSHEGWLLQTYFPHDAVDRAAELCSRQSWGVIASDIFSPRRGGQSSRAMLLSVMRGDWFRHISPTTRWTEQQSYALVSHEGWLLQTYFPHDAVDRAAELCSRQSWGVIGSDIFPRRRGGQTSRAMLPSVMRGDWFRHISPTTRWTEQQSYALVSHGGWFISEKQNTLFL